MAYFKGPSRFISKKSSILCDETMPCIVKASMKLGEAGTIACKEIELQQNSFSVDLRGEHELLIWHSYTYLIDTTKYYGRWYYHVPLDTFRVLSGTKYIYTTNSYEDDMGDGNAAFEIEFTEEAATMLREAF